MRKILINLTTSNLNVQMKDLVKKVNRQVKAWEKIFAMHTVKICTKIYVICKNQSLIISVIRC